jgi:hypothetical protein
VVAYERDVGANPLLALVAQRPLVDTHPTQVEDELHPVAMGAIEHVKLLHLAMGGAVNKMSLSPSLYFIWIITTAVMRNNEGRLNHNAARGCRRRGPIGHPNDEAVDHWREGPVLADRQVREQVHLGVRFGRTFVSKTEIPALFVDLV